MYLSMRLGMKHDSEILHVVPLYACNMYIPCSGISIACARGHRVNWV